MDLTHHRIAVLVWGCVVKDIPAFCRTLVQALKTE
jgi:hypothetical protein